MHTFVYNFSDVFGYDAISGGGRFDVCGPLSIAEMHVVLHTVQYAIVRMNGPI